MNLQVQTKSSGKRWRVAAEWLYVPRREWAHFALVLAGAVVIWIDLLPLWAQAAGWGALLLIQLVRWRGTWTRPFGVVLVYDLVRSARKGKLGILRCIYALALLAVFLVVYWEQFIGASADVTRLWSGGTAHVKEASSRVSDFTELFVYRLLGIQFAAVVLLTPACTAGAIAEEKERRTLEYLLTSDLSNIEIILGKLVSRVASLALLMLTGLPFIFLLQLQADLDPGLVVTGFLVTVMTMLSTAGLSLLNSVYVSKPLTAIVMTYVEIAVYLLVSGLATWAFGAPGRDEVLFRAASSGNTYLTFDRLLRWQDAQRPTPIAQRQLSVPDFIGEYAGFHGLIGITCMVCAAARLRARNRVVASRRAPRPFTLALRPRRKPPIGDRPMLWKELYAEPIVRFHRAGLVVAASLVSAGTIMLIYVSAIIIIVMTLLGSLALAMNAWARCLGMSLGSLLLLGVAVRAATSISGERDRGTLDSLLASPLAGLTILRAKWRGSVWAVRKPARWLIAIWLVAAATSGVHVVAAAELIVAWFIYAAFLASLGLYLSLVSRSALRATIATLLITLGISLGPWLLGRYLATPDSKKPAPVPGGDDELTYVERRYVYSLGSGSDLARSDTIFAAGLSPSATLFSLAFSSRDLDEDWFRSSFPSRRPVAEPDGHVYGFRELSERMSVPIPGLACYSILALVFWFLTRARFHQCTRGRSAQRLRPVARQEMLSPTEEAQLQRAE